MAPQSPKVQKEVEKQLDMEVMSNEASDEPEEEEDDLEFLLAVDDLQSALAFNASDDRTYSFRAPKRTKEPGFLSSMYDGRELKMQKEEGKRMYSPTESPEKDDTEPLYNQDELYNFLTKDFSMKITRNTKSNEINVKKSAIQNTKDLFFEDLSKELRDLAKEYGKEMDEMHMLFMEVS